MSNIVRTDPFRALDFGLPRFSRFFQELPTEPTIKLDVSEDDKAFFVKAEMPGVMKDDITIEVNGNEVNLAAEVKREFEQKNEKVVHSERYFGRQYRRFTLPTEVDRKKVEAKFDNGVLSLTLPKSGKATGEKIAIQ